MAEEAEKLKEKLEETEKDKQYNKDNWDMVKEELANFKEGQGESLKKQEEAQAKIESLEKDLAALKQSS